ncbi:MAG: beta-galactosidase trimerization domain-containing protein [Chthonomonadales bacterium]|nr:beta-galactosidase trimerization domain-containing protein [Chthonomonadales bacterium]
MSAGALGLAVGAGGQGMGRGTGERQSGLPWYRERHVGIEIGPTGANDRDRTFFSRASGRDWVEGLRRAGAEYGVVFMKDMEFAYYRSRVARPCPNMGSRDLLREVLDAARPHRLPMIAYCQVQYDESSWRAHPEWRMKSSDGADIPGRLCYNSGYIEFIESVLAEMMAYEIAGFHVDMLDYGFFPPVGCWCDSCRAAFRMTYGADLPPGVTWDEAWARMLQFRSDSSARFCKEVEAFVERTKPEISVDFNYHGYPPFNWHPGELPVQHAAIGDFVTAEGSPWVFGHNAPGLLVQFLQGAREDGLVQAVTSANVYTYHDFTVKPAAELTWEVLTCLAHGAQVTVVDKLYYDGALEPRVYETIGAAFAEGLAKREMFGHEPRPEVGLYYSSLSRDWWGRDDPPRYMRAFWGAHLAMAQAHIPTGVILDERIGAAALAPYPIVWLPGTAILTPREVEVFEAYVRQGGRLLITGITGVADQHGRLMDRSSAEPLIGGVLRSVEAERRDHYLRLDPHDAVAGLAGRLEAACELPRGWPMLCAGPMAVYEPTTAAGFGRLMFPYRSENNPWASHMSPGREAGPAMLVHPLGKGVVVTAPCSVDAACVSEYRMPEQRRLLRSVIRWLNPKPPVDIVAPPNVETVVTHDRTKNRLLVHFLAWSGAPTFSAAGFPEGRRVLPPMMEEPLIYPAEVRINTPARGVRLAGSSTNLTRSGTRVRFHSGSIHEVLVIGLP